MFSSTPHQLPIPVSLSLLVAGADEIVGQLFDGLYGISWLHVFVVVGDEDGLCSFDDDDTFLSLCEKVSLTGFP
jgi:hypothetical protein